MSLFGRTLLAAILASLVLLGTRESQAGIEVGDNTESHDAVWTTTDVNLYLDPSLGQLPDAAESITLALSIWSKDSRLPHVSTALGSADAVGYREGQANHSTIRFAAKGAAIAKGALAITQVSYDSEEHVIVDGDIILNGIYTFDNLRQKDKLPCSTKKAPFDLTDVLSHELGHWFGLPDNPDDPHALMYPYFDPSETRTLVLAESDLDALDQLYSTNTAGEKQKQSACSVAVPSRGHASCGLVAVGLLGLGFMRRESKAARRITEQRDYPKR